jgi:hypothetical protein
MNHAKPVWISGNELHFKIGLYLKKPLPYPFCLHIFTMKNSNIWVSMAFAKSFSFDVLHFASLFTFVKATKKPLFTLPCWSNIACKILTNFDMFVAIIKIVKTWVGVFYVITSTPCSFFLALVLASTFSFFFIVLSHFQ